MHSEVWDLELVKQVSVVSSVSERFNIKYWFSKGAYYCDANPRGLDNHSSQ